MSRLSDARANIPEEMRKFAYLEDEHHLLVAKDYLNNGYVASFVREMSLLGFSIEVVPVEISRIQQGQAGKSQTDVDARRQARHETDLRETVRHMLVQASTARATDIHLVVSRMFGCHMFFRVLGKKRLIRSYTYDEATALCASLYNTVMDTGDASWHPTEYQGGSVRDAAWLPSDVYGIRVQSNPLPDGVNMVLRLLKKDPVRITNLDHPFEELGFTPEGAMALEDMTNAGQGIRLTLGSTGSGKSTTLKMVLEKISRAHAWKNLLTIEDPPEYPIMGASQFMVANAKNREERSAKFADAFRAAMRSDPDVIMVGEIRDAITAHLAWECALSGHETYSTLHANDAVDAMERLVEEMGIHPRQVGNLNVMRGLISQALVPVLCPHCREPIRNHPEILDLNLHQDVDLDMAFVTGAGCERCGGLGSVSQALITEVVIPDRGFVERIRAGEGESARDYLAQRWKNRGLMGVEHALRLVNSGLVDPVEAAQKAVASGLIRGRFLAEEKSANKDSESCD
jgi:type II secretory ATPase GspE/PulE/Tfp pilus assembly ATPase PilB-like protein